jgi:hypothetical protein
VTINIAVSCGVTVGLLITGKEGMSDIAGKRGRK